MSTACARTHWAHAVRPYKPPYNGPALLAERLMRIVTKFKNWLAEYRRVQAEINCLLAEIRDCNERMAEHQKALNGVKNTRGKC
jgi:hypothetical protein